MIPPMPTGVSRKAQTLVQRTATNTLMLPALRNRIFQDDPQEGYCSACNTLATTQHVIWEFRQVGDSPEQIVTRFRSVETRKKVAEGSILNSPSGARETSNGRWYNRWPEEAKLERAQGLIKMGLRHKNMDETKSGQYFERYYGGRAEQWALCLKKGIRFNTNHHFEAMHKDLKSHYMHGTHNQRLDKLLMILFELTCDHHYKRLKSLVKGKKRSGMMQLFFGGTRSG
ncbi:hypothetical protein HPB47_000244 [Ixodes persulcatus]|uniref:Uncharacterized protein n=1 Tax=Ixodes persulcatus TaxID=34615 RepID=A0AC60PTT9_IXOPE|nr:hypothetical protein HPB47_000244 [Ixodes persulcatus]